MATATVDNGLNLDPCETAWRAFNTDCWDRWFKKLHADMFYSDFSEPPMPPTVASTLPNGSAIPVVPSSGEDASQTISAIINEQMRNWQADNSAFFDSLPSDSGSGWWKLLLYGGGAILAISLLSQGTPRRYGP
jgi:hypothetical protein